MTGPAATSNAESDVGDDNNTPTLDWPGDKGRLEREELAVECFGRVRRRELQKVIDGSDIHSIVTIRGAPKDSSLVRKRGWLLIGNNTVSFQKQVIILFAIECFPSQLALSKYYF